MPKYVLPSDDSITRRVFDLESDVARQQRAPRFNTEGEDGTLTFAKSITLRDGALNPVVVLDDGGGVTGKRLTANESLIYRGTELDDTLSAIGRGVVGQGNTNLGNVGVNRMRNSVGFMTTTAVTVAGRRYRIIFQPPWFAGSGAGGPFFSIGIKYGTDISLSSNVLVGEWRDIASPTPTYIRPWPIEVEFTAAASGLLSILAWGGSHSTTSGTDFIYVWGDISLTIEDIGTPIPDTGVNTRAGGAWYAGSVPPPTPEVRTYTKEYSSLAVQTYHGPGNPAVGTVWANKAGQGRAPSGSVGRLSSLWIFPNAIMSDLSGAVVNNVEFYGYAEHWYAYAGGTARLVTHGYDSIPGTYGGSNDNPSEHGFGRGEGRWITLPAGSWDQFRTGAAKGVGLTAPSDSNQYYGIFHPAAVLRITYTK